MKTYKLFATHIMGHKLTCEIKCDTLEVALETFKNIFDPKQHCKIHNYEVEEG